MTELALIYYALQEDLPVFGVCRGMQIMAHYFGYEISPFQGHAGTRHKVDIDGNLLEVNSYHDNCVPSEIKPPLAAFARDTNRHVEGFYHQGKPLMAVMWHPERECQVPEFDSKLIRKFFDLPGRD